MRRNKRPDREIYQPGRTRLNPRKADGDYLDDPGGPGDSLDPREVQCMPDCQNRCQEDMDHTGHVSHLNNPGNVHGSESSESSARRRNKRPEMQRYVPKVKLDQQGQVCPNSAGKQAEQTQTSNAGDKTPYDTTTSEQVPVSPQRKVDMKKMVVTVHAEEEKDSPRSKSETHDKQPMPKRDIHPEGNPRLHHLSSEQLGNLSDVSHDSLEWDYASVDAELGSLDLNQDNVDVVESGTQSPLSLSQVGQAGKNAVGSGPHEYSDRGQRGRRRRDGRRGRGGRDPHGADDYAPSPQERNQFFASDPKEHPQHLQQQPLPQREPQADRAQRQRRSSRPEHSHDNNGDENKNRRSVKEHDGSGSGGAGGGGQKKGSFGQDKQKGPTQNRSDESQPTPQSQRKMRQDKDQSRQRKNKQDHKRAPQGEDRQNQRYQGPESGEGRHNVKQQKKSVRQDSSGSDEVRTRTEPFEETTRKPLGVSEDKLGRENFQKRGDGTDNGGQSHGRRRQESIGDDNGKGNKRGKRGRGRGEREDRPKRELERDSGQARKDDHQRREEFSRGGLERDEVSKDVDESGQGTKDGKKMSLKVTFAQNNERLVKVHCDRRAAQDDMDTHINPGHHHPASPHGQTERGRGGRGGGIIRLPPPPQETFDRNHVAFSPNTPTNLQSAPRPMGPTQAWGQAPPQGRGRSNRGRGGTHRTLYDPNNPSKNTMSTSPQQLHFQDPYDVPRHMDSPYPPGFSPQAEYFYNYPYYDYGTESSSSPKQGDAFYSYPPQYFDSGVYADNTHEDPYYHRLVLV